MGFVLLGNAILFGITMKIADLHNEHGFKAFNGSGILFGILWGLSGAVLVLSDQLLANIIMAMNIAFVTRMRLDYFNHTLAASIIILTFALTQKTMPAILISFYLAFAVFGGIKDFLDDGIKSKNIAGKISETMWYYPVSGLVFGFFFGNFTPFIVLSLYTIAYDTIKLGYESIKTEEKNNAS
ncbi:MAG: hypothetical protein NUV57_04790 [archaeon]|nr:hypothetical protein [archaeon]